MANEKDNAAELLKQREANEKAIQAMKEAGLDHNQAVAALKHKREFAARDAEAIKAAKKAAEDKAQK